MLRHSHIYTHLNSRLDFKFSVDKLPASAPCNVYVAYVKYIPVSQAALYQEYVYILLAYVHTHTPSRTHTNTHAYALKPTCILIDI